MKNTLLIAGGFLLYYIAFQNFEAIMEWMDLWVNQRLVSYILTYILLGVPLFVATGFVNVSPAIYNYLGLRADMPKALIAALVFAIPMMIGGLAEFGISQTISWPNLIAKTIVVGCFEELYFRGFLFGQLFRKTRLGFILSILVCSALFAAGHLYQSHDPAILAGVFLMTFMGSVLFAWLYVEWDYNLWVPIFLHTFMNLAWQLFMMGENALGNSHSNIYRGVTIALSIILTLIYKRRTGENWQLTRKRCFGEKRCRVRSNLLLPFSYRKTNENQCCRYKRIGQLFAHLRDLLNPLSPSRRGHCSRQWAKPSLRESPSTSQNPLRFIPVKLIIPKKFVQLNNICYV
ncbi:MAG: CPBP family intramembrane glutamic endopeptidase [Bacteroidia bacterium]